MNTWALLNTAPPRDRGLEAGPKARVFELECVSVEAWAGAQVVFMSVVEGVNVWMGVCGVRGWLGRGGEGSRSRVMGPQAALREEGRGTRNLLPGGLAHADPVGCQDQPGPISASAWIRAPPTPRRLTDSEAPVNAHSPERRRWATGGRLH